MMTKQFVRMSTSLGFRIGPVRKGVTPKRVLEFVLQDMLRIREDNGLADAEALAKFNGMNEAYRNVAHYIAPLTEITSKQ